MNSAIRNSVLMIGLMVGNVASIPATAQSLEFAPMKLIEGAIETHSITMTMSPEGHITEVIVKSCASCALQSFEVETGAIFLNNGQPVTHEQAYQRNHSPGTVVFSNETKRVTKVLLLSAEGE